jgi:glycoprotein endo-alpha-1,2-mannosidase
LKRVSIIHYRIKRECAITLAILMVTVLNAASVLYADRNILSWERAAYWDGRYPSAWAGGGEAIRDALEYTGYEILDANELKAWMDARIADGKLSVVIFCRDIVPDTVSELMSSNCTLRRYLNAGGKIVWYADIPMYYQGHVDGTRTRCGIDGSRSLLGFNAAGGSWDSNDEVVFTLDGTAWGLTDTWRSVRPADAGGFRILARDTSEAAAAWVKHYIAGDDYRGFVRLFDRSGEPNINDLRRAAEYPYVPEPIVPDNQAENEDDIIGVFFYPWYRNPNTSGQWRHWPEGDNLPPISWSANYLPNYPDSIWNPSEQLYDSSNTEVLRWQDKAMARAGIDIAIASWWGIGGYEDAALARAIRICKSVQWCIYYEKEAYDDPTPQKIFNNIKYVVDKYGPTTNYARIDGKWLVFVYGAGGDETAGRWQQAKELLAANGYHVYLNGDKANGPAWDAVHSYRPVVYQGCTDTLPNIDDSAWLSPGFWKYGESPRLERSLSEFTSAWNNIIENKESCRFVLIETWNEWHEGTQIEPGQEIIPDPKGYKPKPDGDYGHMFIDTIAPAAVNDLHWKTAGHRASVPARLQAEEMVWDDDSKIELLDKDPNIVLILEEDIRIGSSIFMPVYSNDVTFTVRANSITAGTERSIVYPKMGLYIDDSLVFEWEVQGSVPGLGIETNDQDYSAAVFLDKGIHKVELEMTDDVGGGFLLVDYVDVNALFTEAPSVEGF